MKIHFIEKGTLLYVAILAENPVSAKELNGSLHETQSDTTLFIDGSDLFEYCLNQPTGIRLSVTFFRGVMKYSFFGKFERTLIKHSVQLTEITAVSGIEEKNRRSFARLRLSMPAKLYVENESSTELICTGEAFDISFAAICYLTNDKISKLDDSKFFVEFTLHKSDNFYLPVKLIRNGNAPQSLRFKFDYVFLFDFSEDCKERDRLINSFFKKPR